ncbi:hypothetical protein V8C44DRAFT_323746 [Trichoderma aethiopicum]
MSSPVPSTATAVFLIVPQTLVSRPTSDTPPAGICQAPPLSIVSRPAISPDIGGGPFSTFRRNYTFSTTLGPSASGHLDVLHAMEDEPYFGHVDQDPAHSRADKHLSCARLQHSRASAPNALGVPPANLIANQNCPDLSTDSPSSPTGTPLSGHLLQFSNSSLSLLLPPIPTQPTLSTLDTAGDLLRSRPIELLSLSVHHP